MTKKRLIHVIACAVLKLDLEQTARDMGVSLSTRYLPGGLHEKPRELRERLQEAVDQASRAAAWDMIGIGYGLCGSGTVGIRSRDIPLAIPRVHDCISLFLGSDAAYRREFARTPGTYYISAGWVDGKSEPLSQGRDTTKSGRKGFPQEQFERLVAEYGEENAEAIRRFLTSWQRNYRRAAFIDTEPRGKPGSEDDSSRYARMARDMAAEFGWRYERLQGSRRLLQQLLTAEETSEEILVVPPHHVTFLDPVQAKLRAALPRDRAPRREEPKETEQGEGRRPFVPSGIGLGIDAGGTYTDAVVYDPAADAVVAKSKAPTTRWDFREGIEAALDGIGAQKLARVRFVALSTTLATNSIVEGTGQKVGLLVMPPYGWTDLKNFRHTPLAIISGQMETDGRELEPIDPNQIRRIAGEMVDKHGVKAFAVAGYASHANPSHEIAVRRIVEEASGLPATCGHDVSEGLNYRVRAETAALNAGIVPYLEAFFVRIAASLRRRGILAPIMVVKSDGSLTSLEEAVARPIETILSGPAASVAGAMHLTGCRDALVVDMGGTTTDTAHVSRGEIATCPEGAVVGGWETHVKALDMRTCGLGGDSLLALEERRLTIGPKRVLPVSRLAASLPETLKTLERIERELHYNETSTRGLEIAALCRNGESGHGPGDEEAVGERERPIVEALRERPMSLHELARRADWTAWQLLPLRSLEERNVVFRCGLTPTDLLHAAGRLDSWNVDAAARLCAVFARIQGVDADAFVEETLKEVARRLALEIFRKQLDESLGSREIEGGAALLAFLDSAVGRRTDGWKAQITTRLPIVGIGAPVHQYLPAAAELLHTEAVIPADAAVANAVGAVTSSVFVHRQVRITINAEGIYIVKGLPDAPFFRSLPEAESYAVEKLTAVVAELAERAGAGGASIRVLSDDQIGSTADGTGVFLERRLEARVVAPAGRAARS